MYGRIFVMPFIVSFQKRAKKQLAIIKMEIEKLHEILE